MAKIVRILIIPLATMLLLSAGTLSLTGPVHSVQASVPGQCVAPSSCKTCHVVQAQASYDSSTAWHLDHGFADFCVDCHGGNRLAADADTAHVGVASKYVDMTTTCQSCHKSEQLTLCVDNYAGVLGLDPSQLSTSSGVITNPLGIQSPGVAAVKPSETKPVSAAAGTAAAAQNPAGNGLLLGVLAICLAGVGGYVWSDRRKRTGMWLPFRQRFSGWLKAIAQPNWTPYSAGILLGLVCIIAVWVGNHTLASAGPMATITSNLVHFIAQPFAENNLYFKAVATPGLTWEVVLLIGVFLGGLLGALSSRTFKIRWEHDPVWNKVFGPSKLKRFGLGFVGAMILQYGASIAGGCTMGLAISGSMLLAPSGFIFMVGMFISGILMALLVYRRRY